MASVLALDKWKRFFKTISSNGGVFKSLYKLWRFDTMKTGTLMGEDSMGNKYYEDQRYMIGRSRWVEYNPMVKWDYDATQVTSEWYGWLHYRTDRVPGDDPAKAEIACCPSMQAWLLPHQENVSATRVAYYPYSTTRPYISVWDGSCGGGPQLTCPTPSVCKGTSSDDK